MELLKLRFTDRGRSLRLIRRARERQDPRWNLTGGSLASSKRSSLDDSAIRFVSGAGLFDTRRFSQGQATATGCLAVSGQGNRYNLTVESASARAVGIVECEEGRGCPAGAPPQNVSID